MNRTFPSHAIVLLEPAVHVVLGAAVLGWFSQSLGAAATVLGVVLLAAGLGFGVPAVRRYWNGAFRVTATGLESEQGIFVSRTMSIDADDVVRIVAKRGARRLHYDPIHALLSLVSNYGSIEIHTRDGEVCVLNPVSLTLAEPAVAAWRRGARAPTWPTQTTWLLHLALAAGVAVCGVGALVYSGDARHAPILFGTAFLLESAFWLSLAAAFARRRNTGEFAAVSK